MRLLNWRIMIKVTSLIFMVQILEKIQDICKKSKYEYQKVSCKIFESMKISEILNFLRLKNHAYA